MQIVRYQWYRLACSTCGMIWQLYCMLQSGEVAPRACNYYEQDSIQVKLPCKHWQSLMGVEALTKPVQFMGSQTRTLH
jgi:hypothetical protein